jgi:hypothetical protein
MLCLFITVKLYLYWQQILDKGADGFKTSSNIAKMIVSLGCGEWLHTSSLKC